MTQLAESMPAGCCLPALVSGEGAVSLTAWGLGLLFAEPSPRLTSAAPLVRSGAAWVIEAVVDKEGLLT